MHARLFEWPVGGPATLAILQAYGLQLVLAVCLSCSQLGTAGAYFLACMQAVTRAPHSVAVVAFLEYSMRTVLWGDITAMLLLQPHQHILHRHQRAPATTGIRTHYAIVIASTVVSQT